jgi:hypothetical protein
MQYLLWSKCFTSIEKWNEWKLNYLKRHLMQNVHLDSVIKLQNLKRVELYEFLPKRKKIENWGQRLQSAKRLMPIW